MRALAIAAMLVVFHCGCDQKNTMDGEHGMKMSGDMDKDMRMMNDRMVKHLGTKDPKYEDRFIDMMIPHHEGAIRMANHALENANRPELKAMARDVIAAQEKEIEQLKKWRREWYGH